MRVAHIITRMIVGGAQENTLLNCLDLVTRHGDDVLLVTGPSTGPEGSLLERYGLSPRQAGNRGGAGELQMEELSHLRRDIHPLHDPAAAWQIRHVIERFRPQVVHTHSAKAGLLGRAVAWRARVPVVVHTVHGAPFHPFQPRAAREFFRRCERYAARRCHHLISVADAMTDLMVSAGVAPREKFTTIYSGMDVEPFVHAAEHRSEVRRRLGIGEDRVVIGKIARLFHLKGHDDLITAAQAVVKRCPEAMFLWVGDGILREPLVRRIESAGLSDHFTLTGLVPPDEVPALIGAMDVLVHTSLREGLARALPQALIAGRPAVSYDIDGAREVVIDDQTGFLIPPRDTGALAEALVRLVSEPTLRTRLAVEGQRRFTDQFRHETMTAEIRRLYEKLLPGNGSATTAPATVPPFAPPAK